jgi:hypothetical protein
MPSLVSISRNPPTAMAGQIKIRWSHVLMRTDVDWFQLHADPQCYPLVGSCVHVQLHLICYVYPHHLLCHGCE